MKIGFSFGRCVGSIVKGEVDINDVLLIVARTNMPTESMVRHVINDYGDRDGYLYGLDINKCLDIGVSLWKSGKIIEPRASGVNVLQVPIDYIWMDLVPTALATSNTVKAAWDTYRMLLGLTEPLPSEDAGSTFLHSPKVNIKS